MQFKLQLTRRAIVVPEDSYYRTRSQEQGNKECLDYVIVLWEPWMTHWADSQVKNKAHCTPTFSSSSTQTHSGITVMTSKRKQAL